MIIRKLFEWAIGLLPTIELPLGLQGGFETAVEWSSFANYYLPMDIFLVLFGVYLTLWLTCIVISAVLKLL